jgi:hypothetical protein
MAGIVPGGKTKLPDKRRNVAFAVAMKKGPLIRTAL